MLIHKKPFALIVATLVLAGCGGGGGSTDPDPADPTPVDPVPITAKLILKGPVQARPVATKPEDPDYWPSLIQSNEEYQVVLPSMTPLVPPSHLAPDFNAITLFYLARYYDGGVDSSYVRIGKIESSDDGSMHVVHVEFCKEDPLKHEQSPIPRWPFALYEVPKLNGEGKHPANPS